MVQLRPLSFALAVTIETLIVCCIGFGKTCFTGAVLSEKDSVILGRFCFSQIEGGVPLKVGEGVGEGVAVGVGDGLGLGVNVGVNVMVGVGG